MAGPESETRLEALTPPPRWLQQGPIANLCKGSTGAAPQAQQDGDPWVRLPCCHDNHGCSGPSKRCAESKTPGLRLRRSGPVIQPEKGHDPCPQPEGCDCT